MSAHVYDSYAIGVVRRERFGGNGRKHLRKQSVVQFGKDRVEVVECPFRILDNCSFDGKVIAAA
jgi:hypothetical protein